jgi:hypothetical protein
VKTQREGSELLAETRIVSDHGDDCPPIGLLAGDANEKFDPLSIEPGGGFIEQQQRRGG